MDISEILPSGSLEEFLDALPDGVVVTTNDGTIVAVNERLARLSGYPGDALVGSPIETLIPRRFSAEHVAMRSTYIREGAPTRSMSARSDIVLRTAEGRELPVDISLSSIDGGRVPVVVAAVRDASPRRATELAREREFRFLTAMSDITNRLFADGDIDATYREVTQRARRLLDADLAFLALAASDGESLNVVFADGHGADGIEDTVLPVHESVAGSVFREREAVLLADAATDTRFRRGPNWPSDLGPALVVPVHAREEILATLTIANRRGVEVFSATEVTLMSAFAAHAAFSLLDARNQATQRRVEVLEVRERMAEAMHDQVINTISAASLVAHSLLQKQPEDETASRLWDIVDKLDDAIKGIREAVFPQRAGDA